MNSHDSVDPVTARAVDIFLARLPISRLPPIRRALLYGSRARGNFHEASDVDLAIGLRAFALEDDRLPPPVFVGREDIIADIEHAVAESAAGGTAVRGRLARA